VKSEMAAARSEVVSTIRARAGQRDLIDCAGAADGCNHSEFMPDAACGATEDVLLDQVVIQLGPDAREQFEAMVNAPSQENPGLRTLLARGPAWET
jgi:uncharacterized protein (DUF1778 family)